MRAFAPFLLGFLLDRSPGCNAAIWTDHRPGHVERSTTICGFHLDGTNGHEIPAGMLPTFVFDGVTLCAAALVAVVGAW